MKRLLALALVVFGLAACQNDPEVINPVGGEVDYELTVAAPELGATRANVNMDSALGAIDNTTDWSLYDVRYILEIYNEDGTTAAKERMVQIVDEYDPVVFKFRIVPHRTYKFVVFADFVAEGNAGTEYVGAGKHHVIGNTLADITIKDDAINDECTDAYFCSKNIEIKNSLQTPITLTRPYAKLRVVTTDLDELNLDVNPAKVVVTYAAGTQPTTFNAITGVIGGANAAEQTFEFEYENLAKPYAAGKDAVDENMTLFADYILATGVDTPIQFTMDVYDENDGLIKSNKFSTDIPVRRNYLTTIIGNVLTTASEVMITIDDDFSNKNNVEDEPYYKQVVLVNTAANLQEAIDNYVNGQTILFDSNIKGVVTLIQKAGVNFVIDGNGYKFDGTLQLDGDARSAGTDSITLKNINFETAESSLDFINAYKVYSGKNYNYLHNLTIENCTFKGSGNNSTVVAIRTRQAYNVVIKNCEATDLHSFGQLTSTVGMLLEKVTVNAGEGGFNFLSSTNGEVVVNECNVTATNTSGDAYGVRVDAAADKHLTINNSTLKAKAPVILRSAKASFTLYVNNSQLLVENGGDSKVVIRGEAAKVIIDGKEAQFVTSTTDLATLLASIPAGQEATVVVPKDNYTSFPANAMHEGITLLCDEGTVFEGSSNLNIGGATVVNAEFKNDSGSIHSSTINGNFKDCTFEGDTVFRYCYAGNGTQSVFEDCYFKENGGEWLFHFDGGNGELICRRCTFDGKRVAIGSAISNLVMEDCTFVNGSYFNTYCKSTISNSHFETSVRPLGNHVTFNNCTYYDEAVNIENLKLYSGFDCKVTIDDKDYAVVSEAANFTKYIAEAERDIYVHMIGHIYDNVTALQKENVNVFIAGNGKMLRTLYINGNSRHTGAETLTIDNVHFSSFVDRDLISSNGTGGVERYAHNVTIQNCSFEGDDGIVVVGLRLRQAYNITIKNCTAKKLHSLGQITSVNGLTVDNVTVNDSLSGINLLSSGKDVNITNTIINATGTVAGGDCFAIRMDAANDNTVNVEKCSFTALEPIVFRSATAAYKFNLIGNNNINKLGNYHIIVTSGVCPTMTGVDGLDIKLP